MEKTTEITEENKKGSLLSGIGICFAFLLITGSIGFAIDTLCLQGRVINSILYKPDCELVVPPGIKIVYSAEEKRYAVQTGPDEYLWNGKRGITEMYSYITKPSTFADSCHAKGYLKAYLEQGQPKMKSYQ